MKKILGVALVMCFLVSLPLALNASAKAVEKNKELVVTVDPLLEVPSDLKVLEKRSTTAHVVWNEVEEATKYELRLADNNENVLGYLRSKSNYKTISSKWLLSNKNYKVSVRTIKGNLASEWSSYITFRTKPAKVKNVEVTNITETSAVVTWHACRGSNLRYIVNLTDGNNELISTSYVTGKTLTLSGLTSNTVYKVKVQAQNSKIKADKGALSEEVLFETL